MWRALAATAVALALVGCGGDDEEERRGTGSAERPVATPTTPAQTQTRERRPREEEEVDEAPATAPRKLVGIGDQNAAFFDAPLFRRLEIEHARRVVPWDAMRIRSERTLMDDWLAGARRAGVEPLITFGASRRDPDALPSVAAFRRAFQAFRRRYPQVKAYAPWNEANHRSQPTAGRPERAAAYYRVVRDGCRGCAVLAADVLDQEGFTGYLRRFQRALGSRPRLWGLHNYSDTNRFRTSGTRDMLRAVDGEVWLTETGGIAQFGRSFPYDLERQARATAYTFRLLRLSPRIRRLYIYNWTGAPRDARFDAGLTNPDGSPRPAYRTLARNLRG
jgi:hypothetical protein